MRSRAATSSSRIELVDGRNRVGARGGALDAGLPGVAGDGQRRSEQDLADEENGGDDNRNKGH